MNFEVAGFTLQGVKAKQEDALLIGRHFIQRAERFSETISASGHFTVAVADGVSSSKHGKLASKTLLKLLRQAARVAPLTSSDFNQVYHLYCETLTNKNFGAATTLALAQFNSNGHMHIAHCGDSRVYLHQGNWQALTADHNVANELNLKSSVPLASMYRALTQCFIADWEEQMPQIERNHYQLQIGDKIVLCTDGVHDVVAPQNWPSTSLTTEKWLQTLAHCIFENGAPDNASAVLITVI